MFEFVTEVIFYFSNSKHLKARFCFVIVVCSLMGNNYVKTETIKHVEILKGSESCCCSRRVKLMCFVLDSTSELNVCAVLRFSVNVKHLKGKYVLR